MQDDQRTIRNSEEPATCFTELGSVDGLTGGNTNRTSDSGPGMMTPTISASETYESLPPR